MALYFDAPAPAELLNVFKAAIDSKRVTDWSYDSDGDFTLTGGPWAQQAWLRARVEGEQLVLWILNPQGAKVSAPAYAAYHARFLEAMLTQCEKFFRRVSASAFPEGKDKIAPAP